jgi:tetratricopeptide (TPR) repeat protein
LQYAGEVAGNSGIFMTTRFLTIFLAASISVVPVPALPQSPDTPAAGVSQALRANDFDKAIELTRQGLKQNPSDAQLWTLQGIAFASKGDSRQALQSFQSALEIAPNNIGALAGAAQIQYQAGNQEAVPLLNRLLKLRPGDPTANAMLAVLNYQAGNCAAAVPHFAEAAPLVDTQVDALHAYATCLVRLKRFDDAIAILQKSAQLQPGDLKEHMVLASVQMMAHKPQDASATLRPLLDAASPPPAVLQLASRAFEEAGDTPQAVALLRQALIANPKDTSLYLDFANICFSHQSFQVGIDVITEGLTLQPNADELYVARGVLYVQLAQYDTAEADFEKAYAINPNQSMSVAAQGLTAVQTNDLDHALMSIQDKLKKKPDDPLLLYLQADVLSQKGAEPGSPDFALALKSAKRAVALQPSNASARSVLAKLYMQTGQYPQAIEQCRRALDSDPKDQTAVYRLIQALRKTGQTEELPELLKRLAQLREQATKEENERNRYKLLEDEPASAQP